MEQSHRPFVFSSDLFSNFSLDISLYYISTIDDITNYFKEELLSILEKNNLVNLTKILKEKNLHIHGYNIEDILTSNNDHIFYICDHTSIE